MAGRSAARDEVTSVLYLQLFGPAALSIDGSAPARLSGRKPMWLLALLALRHGRAVPREWLAGTLWPESGEKQEILRIHIAQAEALAGRRLFEPPDVDAILTRTVSSSPHVGFTWCTSTS